jgi:hypothetical protein
MLAAGSAPATPRHPRRQAPDAELLLLLVSTDALYGTFGVPLLLH